MAKWNRTLRIGKRAIMMASLALIPIVTMAEPSNAKRIVLDSFMVDAPSRWEFIADGVMGGVSTGELTFPKIQGKTSLRLTGSVSTENRGGFIQARYYLQDPLPVSAKGIWLKVRGNNQRYFVHLRTNGTILPWQYYQAGFDVSGQWQLISLSWSDFKPSGGLSGSFLRANPLAETIESIAIVAFGRDHQAEIEVAEIGYE